MPRDTFVGRLVPASLLVVTAACLPTHPATTASIDGDRERIARFASQAEALRVALHVPGLAAAIVRDGHVVWARGFGFADVEGRVPVSDTTPFPVGSLTKPFTSTLLLRLVEQGSVSLDDPIRKYTDELSDARVSVRTVASPTGGADGGGPGDERYVALTRVLERATGQPFRALLAREILEPLHMRHTVPGADIADSAMRYAPLLGDSTIARYRAALATAAKPYRLFAGVESVRSFRPTARMSAAAGLVASVRDLAAFDSALDGHALLRPRTQQLAWSPPTAEDGHRAAYAIGWRVRDYRWQRFLWQYDHAPDAFSSLIVKVPANGLTLVLLANGDGLSAGFYESGGMETNPIACEFLRLFVFEPQLGRRLADPAWSDDTAATSASIEAASRESPYDYACERQDARLVADRRARTARRVPAVVQVERATGTRPERLVRLGEPVSAGEPRKP